MTLTYFLTKVTQYDAYYHSNDYRLILKDCKYTYQIHISYVSWNGSEAHWKCDIDLYFQGLGQITFYELILSIIYMKVKLNVQVYISNAY